MYTVMNLIMKKLAILAGLMLLAPSMVLADSGDPISDIDRVNQKLLQSPAPKRAGWHIGFTNSDANANVAASQNPQICRAAAKAACPASAPAAASQPSAAQAPSAASAAANQ
jgi:hypothetical protein